MKDIGEIIEFENENTSLDFKAIQYVKDYFEAFLKDVISMSNGKSKDRKLIIVGVKLSPNGEREFLGIGDDFIDEATYQQMVFENIEPEIQLAYTPIKFKNKQLGVFELKDCSDPPYMMKKDYKGLKKGDSFIRKGSHQTRVTRKDIDFFIETKIGAKSFKGSVDINFLDNGTKVLELKPITDLFYPSIEAEEEIKRILKKKEDQLSKQQRIPILAIDQDIPMLGGTPYENRSTTTLRENLKNVKKTYEEDDLHYLFESRSYHLNFSIQNNGEEYIEDASIKFMIEKDESMLIANQIFEKPDNRSWIHSMNETPSGPSWISLNYPEVTESKDEYVVFENLGNLKHLIKSEAFQVPLRVICNANGIGKEFKIRVFLYGKNLQKPLTENLSLKIVE